MLMTAIDTSFFQHHPDYAQVKMSGITLGIMKAVDVEAGFPSIDSVYFANRAAERAAGLRVGSYLFNGPMNPTAAAHYFWSVIDWKPGEIAAIDVENALGVNRWNPAQVFEFCSILIGHGIPAGLILAYMSSSVTRAYDWSPVVALGVELWVAQYNANDGTVGAAPALAHWPSWALWQWTSVGTVPGISGRVDMNQINPSFETRMAGLDSTLITETKPKEAKMLIVYGNITGDSRKFLLDPFTWTRKELDTTQVSVLGYANIPTIGMVEATLNTIPYAVAPAVITPSASIDIVALAAALAPLVAGASKADVAALLLASTNAIKNLVDGIPKALTKATVTLS
jgi:GH25 family lysozyme M1 (1,4-beta-N-acetylmuramidase)